jgi:hypothetical protein
MLKQHDDKSALAASHQIFDMNVDVSTVIIMAQPESAYMIVRIVNHWITNLVNYHPDRETYMDNEWYIKWQESYPYMRSSRRSFFEIYRTLTRNYKVQDKDVTVYMLIDYLKANIPEFIHQYDITEYNNNPNDANLFQFTLNLYYSPKDHESNTFADLASTEKDDFVAYNEIRSIMSYGHTNSSISHMSKSHASLKVTVPEVSAMIDTQVHTGNEDNTQLDKVQNPDLSLSPNELSSQALGPSLRRNTRSKKKTEDLRTLVSQTCQNEIQSEMTALRSELNTTIADSIAKLTELMVKPTIANVTQPTTIPEIKPITIPSTYRKSMPSPRQPPATAQRFDQHINSESTIKRESQYDNTAIRPYQRSGTLNFEYENSSYELRDGVFNKESAKLMEVHNDNDLVQFYQQLQTMVIMYNIFLQEFALLQPWQKSANTIPSTCIFDTIDLKTNTIDAYRRMKTALYTKLTKVKFHNPEHKAIIQHGAIEQDGFEILYDLMTHCHPRLMNATIKYRKVNARPTFNRDDSIYSYCTSLQNWLDIEHINDHHYSNDDLLDIVIEQLRDDTRYDVAVAGIQSEITMRDMMIRQVGPTPYPENLLLRNLPSTIMSYYTVQEKQQLFAKPSTTSMAHQLRDVQDMATINSYTSNPLKRESVDKFCQGCGQFGHSVYHNGCDFCAKLLLANDFLKKHPNAADATNTTNTTLGYKEVCTIGLGTT